MTATLQWEIVHRIGYFPETYPLNDLREHDLAVHRALESESGLMRLCWCHPYMDGEVIVHNSLDRREDYENGKVRLQ